MLFVSNFRLRIVQYSTNSNLNNRVFKCTPAFIRNFHVFKVNEENSNVTFNNTKDIFIKNTQTKFDINSTDLIIHIDKIRRIMGYPNHRVDVWICNDLSMAKYNSIWRGKKTSTNKLSTKRATRATVVTGRRTHKGVGKSTDVLSFPGMDFTGPGQLAPIPTPNQEDRQNQNQNQELLLGELIVSPAYVHKQCVRDLQMDKDGFEFDFDPEEVGVNIAMSTKYTVNERIPYLLLHGLVHCIGYDHENMKDWKQMTSKEQEILNTLKYDGNLIK